MGLRPKSTALQRRSTANSGIHPNLSVSGHSAPSFGVKKRQKTNEFGAARESFSNSEILSNAKCFLTIV